MEYKYFNKSNIIIRYLQRNHSLVNINLELLRCDFFNNILDMFLDLIQSYYPKEVFSKKKPFRRSIANILSSFIFSQYRKKNNMEDIFIPKITDVTLLFNIFKDYLSISNLETANLNKLLEDFFKNYKKIYQDFLNEKQNLKYHKIEIKLKNVMIKTSEFIKLFPNKIFDKKYQVIIYKERFQNLENIYIKNGGKENFIEVLYCILLRYFTLGSNNNQLAVSPSTMKQFKDEYMMSFESFASAINFNSNYFCSLYPDLESIFGSFGNFFEVEFIKGCFNFNPPFQEDIINLGINKIFYHLENSKEDLTFIITIPVWDTIGKKLFGIEDKYSDLPIINKIRESKFLVKIEPIDKKNFDYHDYIFNLVKNVTIQNTYVIILSNKKVEDKYLKSL